MRARDRVLRVGIYGTGKWAQQTHIPNLRKLEKVEIVAASDIDPERLRKTAERFSIPRIYEDAHEMLEKEELDKRLPPDRVERMNWKDAVLPESRARRETDLFALLAGLCAVLIAVETLLANRDYKRGGKPDIEEPERSAETE